MTTFVDNSTVIQAIWLNGVDRAVTQAIGDGSNPPTTTAEVQDNLGINLKADTSYVDSQDALKSDITTTVTKDSSTGAGHLPVGTTAQRPGAPVDGMMRFNQSINDFEGYKSSGGWITFGNTGFAAGTRMPFAQADAPTGWTQDTTDAADNRMLRVVKTGGGGYSGSHSPILNNVVPSHTHTISIGTQSANHTHTGTTGGQSADHTHGYSRGSSNNWTTDFGTTRFVWDQNGTDNTGGASVDHNHSFTTAGPSVDHNHAGTIAANTGAANWTPRFTDLIICSKD